MQAAAAAEAAAAEAEKKQKKAALRRERLTARLLREEVEEQEEEEDQDDEREEEREDEDLPSGSSRNQQCSKIVTPLVGEPEPSQLPRWSIRGMWQLASILNFFNVCHYFTQSFFSLLEKKIGFFMSEVKVCAF